MSKYTSKYKIGQPVKFLNKDAEVTGINYTKTTIRYNLVIEQTYDVDNVFTDLIEGEANKTNWDDTIKFHISDDDVYWIIMDDVVIKDCRILGCKIYEIIGGLDCRYKVGYSKTGNVMDQINPAIIYKEEDAISLLRERKIDIVIN